MEKLQRTVLEYNEARQYQLQAELKAMLLRLPYIKDEHLADFAYALFELKRQLRFHPGLNLTLSGWNPFYELIPSWKDEKGVFHLASNLLAELRTLVEQHGKRCLAIVARAGRGKTNLVCHLSGQLVAHYPVILLSGQWVVDAVQGIEGHVQQQLESQFKDLFPDWMNRLSPSLRTSASWMFVIIDGINENTDTAQYARIVSRFLSLVEGRRIKLIVTCRDIYWEIFEPHLKPYLFEEKTVDLDAFNVNEWNQALKVYFGHFDIQGMPSSEAREALKNPLLLRFFCEANRGYAVGAVQELGLLSSFNVYLERISGSIGERLMLRKDAVIDFLTEVGLAIWIKRRADVFVDELPVDRASLTSIHSLYNLIRDENIILEEQSGLYGQQRKVRFVYDEFMEYMVARAWLRILGKGGDNNLQHF